LIQNTPDARSISAPKPAKTRATSSIILIGDDLIRSIRVNRRRQTRGEVNRVGVGQDGFHTVASGEIVMD